MNCILSYLLAINIRVLFQYIKIKLILLNVFGYKILIVSLLSLELYILRFEWIKLIWALRNNDKLPWTGFIYSRKGTNITKDLKKLQVARNAANFLMINELLAYQGGTFSVVVN